jgi:hypothetical protein
MQEATDLEQGALPTTAKKWCFKILIQPAMAKTRKS